MPKNRRDLLHISHGFCYFCSVKEDSKEYFNPKKYKCWIFPALPQLIPSGAVKQAGKATAIAALCLLAFLPSAFGQRSQASGHVLHVAPGQIIFTYQTDTLDTNAMPAFFRALGCDSAAAIQRATAVINGIQGMRNTDELDIYLQRNLQGIGLRHYAWFRRWVMQCDDDREEYLGESKNRK